MADELFYFRVISFELELFMAVHIHIVTPIVPTGLTNPGDFEGILHPDDQLTYSEVQEGPEFISSEFDEMLAAPSTVAETIAAEKRGVDAVVIDCMGDPGLRPARECVKIPVFGPCETSMHLACILGHRFSLLSMENGAEHQYENQARIYGAWDKYCSVRSVEIPVNELSSDRRETLRQLESAAEKAILVDGADVLVLGCTGMVGVAADLERLLRQSDLEVSVIDPVPTTVRFAKAMIESGLSHSKRIYRKPEFKLIRGYAELRSSLSEEK